MPEFKVFGLYGPGMSKKPEELEKELNDWWKNLPEVNDGREVMSPNISPIINDNYLILVIRY